LTGAPLLVRIGAVVVYNREIWLLNLAPYRELSHRMESQALGGEHSARAAQHEEVLSPFR
jgi:hypothetical protein